jgi:hypothetical protein
MRMLLERMRAVMLLRHAPEDAKRLLARFGEEEVAFISKAAKDAKSPINSAALVRMIDAALMTDRTAIRTLPLELALIELTTQS